MDLYRGHVNNKWVAGRLGVRPKVNKKREWASKHRFGRIIIGNGGIMSLKKARKRTAIKPKHVLFLDTRTRVEPEYSPNQSKARGEDFGQ